MKIPLDYFLYIVKNFLDDLDLKDVTKVLDKHIEIPEKEYVIIKIYKIILIG